MQTYFVNTLCIYFSIFHLLRWDISLKLALPHDKNWKNYAFVKYNQVLLIYSNAYASFFNRWIGQAYRFNLVINA